MSRSPQEIGEIIGKWIAGILVAGLVIAGVVAWISGTLTFWGIITWFMSAIGWWILGAIGLAILIPLLILGFLNVLPVIAFAGVLVGVALIFTGHTLWGILLIIGSGAIFSKFTGWW